MLNLPVRAFHNVGNAGVIFESGQISDVFWPGGDPSADDYQCCGGPWAGTSSDGVVLDFMWTADAAFTSSSGPGKSDQDIVSAFTDGGAIGLSVEQRSYQWSAENVDDGVIFEYEYTNTSGGEIPELFVALFIDADIVGDDPFYQDDLVGYDSSQRLIYMWDSGDLCVTEGVPCPTGYIGVALLNDGSGTANPEPHTATTYLFDKSEFDAMTEGINPSLAGSVDANDHRMILTAQPFALAPGTSRTVTFALVMGGSLAELQSNTDALRQAYESQVVNVEHTVSSEIPANYALGQNSNRRTLPSVPFPFEPQLAIMKLPSASHTKPQPLGTPWDVNSSTKTPVLPSKRSTFSSPAH